MECKACGTWFVSGQNDGVCLSCKTRLKKMGLDIPYDRLRVLVEADRDGRLTASVCWWRLTGTGGGAKMDGGGK